MSVQRRRRERLRKAFRSLNSPCWSPAKIKYPTLRDARRAAAYQLGEMRPYVCGGHYHLTSKPVRSPGDGLG